MRGRLTFRKKEEFVAWQPPTRQRKFRAPSEGETFDCEITRLAAFMAGLEVAETLNFAIGSRMTPLNSIMAMRPPSWSKQRHSFSAVVRRHYPAGRNFTAFLRRPNVPRIDWPRS